MSALASPEAEAEGDGGVVLGGASSIAVSSMFEGVMEGRSGRVWLRGNILARWVDCSEPIWRTTGYCLYYSIVF